uniref:Uncharacterized protein n=1 Tax=Pyricularia oryzae (strain P131) TaxID=1143193 RepID=L7IPU9_PYRO1
MEGTDRAFGSALNAAAIGGYTAVTEWIMSKCDNPARYVDLAMVVEHIRGDTAATMTLLLKTILHSLITQDIFRAAAGSMLNGGKVIRVLLTHRGDQIQITENLLNAVPGNDQNGAELMEMFLAKKETRSRSLRIYSKLQQGTTKLAQR